MTKQITIKLNERKFKPILEKIIQCENNTSRSYSEVTGKAIFFAFKVLTEKLEELDNQTIMDHVCKKRNLSKEKCQIEFIRKYSTFISNK